MALSSFWVPTYNNKESQPISSCHSWVCPATSWDPTGAIISANHGWNCLDFSGDGTLVECQNNIISYHHEGVQWSRRDAFHIHKPCETHVDLTLRSPSYNIMVY